jgi:hypothetical protein
MKNFFSNIQLKLYITGLLFCVMMYFNSSNIFYEYIFLSLSIVMILKVLQVVDPNKQIH